MLIEKIFQGRYSIPILKIIILTPEGCSITDVSKELNISKSVVFKNISELKEENILISFTRGKRKLYKLNEDNYFVRKLVKRIFELEDQVVNEVRDFIIKKFKRIKILSLVLYGSFLTPKFDFKSDLDLMVIVKRRNKIKGKIEKITKYFSDSGLTLFVDIIELSEFKRLYKIREPLIVNLIKNDVVLHGKHPIELI